MFDDSSRQILIRKPARDLVAFLKSVPEKENTSSIKRNTMNKLRNDGNRHNIPRL